MKLLLIEDDLKSSNDLCETLKKEGYVVDAITNGEIGLEMALFGSYDLLVVGCYFPTIEGITIVKELRNQDLKMPIMLLSARDNLENKVAGLDAGADDYLEKPFSAEEFSARLRALARRNCKDLVDSSLEVAGLILDSSKCKVAKGSEFIKLSIKETRRNNH